MSKKKASEETAVEMNEVDHTENDENGVPVIECIKKVCDFITGHFIDLKHPRNGDQGLCDDEFEMMSLAIEVFIERWLDECEDLTISEARGVLFGIAMQYENSVIPGVYECHRLAIILARYILDCLDDELLESVIHNPTMVEGAEQLDDFI